MGFKSIIIFFILVPQFTLLSQSCPKAFQFPLTFEKVPVFILIGQSNAMGEGFEYELLPGEAVPNPDVKIASYWNEGFEDYYPSSNSCGWAFGVPNNIPIVKTNDFGIELSLSQKLQLDFDTIYIVKGANQGSSLLNHWSPLGNTWNAFVELLNETNTYFYQRQLRPDYLFIIWHQGESDTNNTNGYYNNLLNFHDLLQTIPNLFYTPLIIPTIKNYNAGAPFIKSYHLNYSIENDNVFYIETEYLSYDDNVHLDGQGLRDVGDLIYDLWKNNFNRN